MKASNLFIHTAKSAIGKKMAAVHFTQCLASLTQPVRHRESQNVSKVSLYPKIDHFSKKLFFACSDRSYYGHLKNLYEKRLILGKVTNEKRFFALIISN